MHIIARCHPLLEPLLPRPVPAAQALPGWLGEMPSKTWADTLGGAAVRTLKHCPPIIDAMRLGVLVLCPTEITVRAGEVSWDWDPPILPDANISRAPVGVHVPEQAIGSPYVGTQLILKFMNFWTLETPVGWSLMFIHPQGYPDLPFTTLAGVVDCDTYKDGYVHFPALLKPGFEGVIAKGTPIAQAVPVQKDLTLKVGAMSPDQIARNRTVQDDLSRVPGRYRRVFRR
jgi:hypothetical protein